MKEKLLLHQCCAICTSAIFELLSSEFDITGLWFNPNIHPFEEKVKRFDALVSFNRSNATFFVGKNSDDEKNWLEEVKKFSDRCEYCYLSRMEFTAKLCQEKGYKYFSTTLLSSPYQKHELIQKIARSVADKNKLHFIYLDGRKNYQIAKDKIKKMGLYSQKYCGCIFSRDERIRNMK